MVRLQGLGELCRANDLRRSHYAAAVVETSSEHKDEGSSSK